MLVLSYGLPKTTLFFAHGLPIRRRKDGDLIELQFQLGRQAFKEPSDGRYHPTPSD